jgi:hypothetical protein
MKIYGGNVKSPKVWVALKRAVWIKRDPNGWFLLKLVRGVETALGIV